MDEKRAALKTPAWEATVESAIFKVMTIFDYNYQNQFRYCFLIQICQYHRGLKNNIRNLHKQTTKCRILVVVVR